MRLNIDRIARTAAKPKRLDLEPRCLNAHMQLPGETMLVARDRQELEEALCRVQRIFQLGQPQRTRNRRLLNRYAAHIIPRAGPYRLRKVNDCASPLVRSGAETV